MSEERQYKNVGRAMFKTSDHISSELRQFTNVERTTVWETSEKRRLFGSDGKSVGIAKLFQGVGIAKLWRTTFCPSSNCRSCDDYNRKNLAAVSITTFICNKRQLYAFAKMVGLQSSVTSSSWRHLCDCA